MNYIYDYSKLNGRLREKNLTQSELAKKIGICDTSLNLSLNSKRPFKQSEISKICEYLSIQSESIASYFFCKTTLDI